MGEEKLSFVFEGTEYDASEYVAKHPGGEQFLIDMRTEKHDFTEYFISLHSEQARAILESLPVLGTQEPTASSKTYEGLRQKVKYLYQPNWVIEVLLMAFVYSLMLISVFTENWLLAGLLSGLVQTVTGWMAHSMAHSRNFMLQKVGACFAALTCGYSLSWWSSKHNRHHMFTNSTRYDDDIKHDYKRYLFPFLQLKWRFDSVEAALRKGNLLDLALFAVHYAILLNQNPIPLIIGHLFFGYYLAIVLIGNHEREIRFKEAWKLDFIDHQLVTSRDYHQVGWFWLIMMGGMQYQAEHHLFPQIPFYNIPEASVIIRAWLKENKKELVMGPVM